MRRIRSGRSSATLIVLVPIEPVLPSKTTFFIACRRRRFDLPLAVVCFDQRGGMASWPGQYVAEVKVHDGGIKKQTVEQVENTTDPGKKLAAIFDARLAFKQLFYQISDNRRDPKNGSQNYCV